MSDTLEGYQTATQSILNTISALKSDGIGHRDLTHALIDHASMQALMNGGASRAEEVIDRMKALVEAFKDGKHPFDKGYGAEVRKSYLDRQ